MWPSSSNATHCHALPGNTDAVAHKPLISRPWAHYQRLQRTWRPVAGWPVSSQNRSPMATTSSGLSSALQ